MLINLIKKIIGTRNERVLKKLYKIVGQINALEPGMQKLASVDFPAKTAEFRARLKAGASLNNLLPEAFALAREAARRALGERHFDVQLIGGMVLHEGKIAEMRTGEGKTLVATLPAYLNALTGKSVHIITVNDYLAKRDAAWMEPVYNFLGLSVGVVLSGQSQADKQAAYAKDITYGTNNEFGFDYLRDNMAFSLQEKVQRGLYFSIVDEVDSILIDEARTPLIISGPSEDSSDLYAKIDKIVPLLKRQKEEKGPGDVAIDEKTKQAFLTEEGHRNIERIFTESGLIQNGASLYDIQNIRLMHYLNAAMRAHHLFHRDVDYIVRNGEVIIVDEHTGRTMEGRRWSDGLHQAMEAKEHVEIKSENQTLASITFQNYFRLYEKLAGMTGTADTEAYEFQQIYNLEVIVIPTNRPMIRKDFGDQIYLTEKEKFKAIIEDIKIHIKRGQPVLVGTASIEKSEILANLLDKEKISHQVLNAKHHEREAKIISDAGRPSNVTIATNMAGRGTDIVLGGSLNTEIAALDNPTPDQIAEIKADWKKRHDEVVAGGGLHITGSERHESRRIDNQLRGRAGRQGDPGSSRFYLSLEDNLMRIFASDRVAMLMKTLGMHENEAIEHRLITKAVENAQRKVEGHNFDIRKHLLEFDDVANEQRKVIYSQRDELMAAADISDSIREIITDVLNNLIDVFIPRESLEEEWQIVELENELKQAFGFELPIHDWLKADESMSEQILREKIAAIMQKYYLEKEEKIGSELMRQIEKSVMLQTLDHHWKEHLAAMDHLREGIHLRGYAQQNPKQEYKRESFKMFESLLNTLKFDVIKILFSIQIKNRDEVSSAEEERRLAHEKQKMNFIHSDAGNTLQKESGATDPSAEELAAMAEEKRAAGTPLRHGPKIGRNDLCSCGSGKKYKHCCGKLS